MYKSKEFCYLRVEVLLLKLLVLLLFLVLVNTLRLSLQELVLLRAQLYKLFVLLVLEVLQL
ncbi:hypothetical protein EX290_01135 [Enterococcus faecium]|uniref:Uncharacterized protein n=2 Tax=Enterococcus faecium TaxID=1352 RepID=A0AB74CW72_ENTFC|nr:hypothetical protein EA467_05445 [Enterococcus faecium]ELA71071.1 hypothetical protein OGO_00313 [Enterococcus faecium EnGen0015]ELB07659.1 hypothetical protein OIG_03216 [Enterococcus faecium EnGen0028]ELB07753.1 hypothetical protein OII_04480 [Enterococcus faecium EnGen0029]ELB28835.1 hypothetical protein OK5_04834 [Enterococcus faecium EnGen0042]ELB38450.1 hypothetical protein OKA_05294 [Enterococcus faecium EnGen0026]MBO1093537.1 hypothetical protein [Enterococcus lactis]MSS54794.1 hy